MQKKLAQLTQEINTFNPKNAEDLENFRIQYLGSKGVVKKLFEEFKSISNEDKRILGKTLNEVKNLIENKYSELKSGLSTHENIPLTIDLTLPGETIALGARHPLSLVKKEIIDIFKKLAFTVQEGPELEDDWHNFTALNFPKDHPARDMQDTFFIKKDEGINNDILLRTHTSNVQIRLMQNEKPPFRAIIPGRVYRNEAISSRAHCFFHQIEVLCVDVNISFADLKHCLLFFAQELFGKKTEIRIRPSYFPFTEPSAEMDISCTVCNKKGCTLCKHSGWVEILGCGMVDPNVLNNCGINTEIYTGYAIGMGIERITSLKYQINDLRLYSENDIRFLKQFQSELNQ